MEFGDENTEPAEKEEKIIISEIKKTELRPSGRFGAIHILQSVYRRMGKSGMRR